MNQVCVLYVGSTKIVGLRGRINFSDHPNAHADKESDIQVEKLVKTTSRGFNRGVVVDLEEATEQVQGILDKVVGPKYDPKMQFYVVLSNQHIQMASYSSSLFFGDHSKTILQNDVDRVIAQTRSTATIPLSRAILLSSPQEYLVDDLGGIRNPLDLDAKRLGVKLSLFTVDMDVYKNLNKIFDRLDIHVSGFIPRVVTASYSVLRPEEKRDGIVLIDIGGYNTGFAFFSNGNLTQYDSLSYGSEYITEVLSENFNISHLEARKLKENYGSAQLLERFEDEIIPVVDVFGNTKFNINKKRLFDQVHIATRELAERFFKVLERNRDSGAKVCGVVVTGGGAQLDGFLDVIQRVFGLTTRVGMARNISGASDAITNCSFASQFGVFDYLESENLVRLQKYQGKNLLTRKMLGVKEWIQENF